MPYWFCFKLLSLWYLLIVPKGPQIIRANLSRNLSVLFIELAVSMVSRFHMNVQIVISGQVSTRLMIELMISFTVIHASDLAVLSPCSTQLERVTKQKEVSFAVNILDI